MKIDGQCHCGQIRFSAEIEPHDVFICHCTDCQHFSGGPYRASVRAPVETVAMQGEPKVYVKTAESGAERAQGFLRTSTDTLDQSVAVSMWRLLAMRRTSTVASPTLADCCRWAGRLTVRKMDSGRVSATP